MNIANLIERPDFLHAVCEWEQRDRNGNVIERGQAHNFTTNSGRNFAAAQAYGTSPGANGLNYIGMSNDSVTETAVSTTLSNEIATAGFTRAQGTVTNPSGISSTTTTDTGGTGANSATDTTINVVNTQGMVAGTVLQVAGEQILVGAVASTTQLTGCTRGYNSTTGAVHASGSTVSNTNTTVVTKTFTATGSVSCQKAALFSASSGGTMSHVVSMGARTLQSGDSLAVTFYICLG